MPIFEAEADMENIFEINFSGIPTKLRNSFNMN
jgi:hypothetical protein